MSELECYLIEQYDVVFQSPISYYSLLAEAKISCCKAQKKNPRKDPEVVKKRNQEIHFMLKRLMPSIKLEDIAVYAVDEVHLLEGSLISHGWGDSQERLKIPIINCIEAANLLGRFRPDKPRINCACLSSRK
nr:hypothetical protein [Ancylothrix sp. D3o]